MKAYNLQTALQFPEQTTALFIYNLNLTRIPEEAYTLKNLKVLGLGNNKISKLSDQLKSLKGLEEIDLADNNIEVFPEVLFELQGLKILNLSANQISEIPETIFKNTALENLNLSSNQVEALVEKLFYLPQIKKLDLSNNRIKKIPEAIGKGIKLERIFLQKNAITKLPTGLAKCTNLNLLNLSDNKLSELPEFIGNFTKLEKLKLSGNKLKALPSGLSDCLMLRELDCCKNKITTIPKSIGRLKWLKRFLIARNKLHILPDELESLNALESLDVSRNKLKVLPPGIGKLSRLKILNSENNLLTSLPTSFEELKFLQALLLKGNKIVAPEVLFLNLINLQKISGLDLIFATKEKQRLLRFLKYCKQDRTNSSNRKSFYTLLVSEKIVSKIALIDALSFPMTTVQKRALAQLLSNHNASVPLTTKSVLSITGKYRFGKRKVIESLKELGISYQKFIDDKTTHVVLGHYPGSEEKLKHRNFTLLSEGELQTYIIANKESQQKQLSEKAIENLSRLLLSAQEDNIKIAIQILSSSTSSKILITELFIAYKTTQISGNKKALRNLIELSASSELKKRISIRATFSHKNSEVVMRNIERYTEGTELDKEKIQKYFLTRN